MKSPNRIMTGRKVIYTDETAINAGNVLDVLNRAMLIHTNNEADIRYLYNYYRGIQPIMERTKDVRPEIMNIIVENRANEIVSFKNGYLMGEPIQYVSRGSNDGITEKINQLNEFMFAEDKASKDEELGEWFHICGTSYRMVLPDSQAGVETDEAPFEIYTLDPRRTFVVYGNQLGFPPLMGVTYTVSAEQTRTYSVYTQNRFYRIRDNQILEQEATSIGIPIIEYPANNARLGAFEIVLPLLDAINTVDSNRLDGVEQFVQALMLFHNVNIADEDFEKLRERGGLRFTDVDNTTKGEVSYLTSELNQSQTQTLIDHLYDTILTICGMPNRNGGSSTSDTGSAVIMRDGWSAAEARAKKSELVFKKSEKEFLKQVLAICRTLGDVNLKLSDIEIRFTRRNYENISEKANVLTAMLANDKIHPQLAFTHCGMFIDPEIAYSESMAYYEEQGARDAGNTNVNGTDGGGNQPLSGRRQPENRAAGE